jgi:hypothetical protein
MAAIWRAAAYVERDGPAQQSELLSFLSWELDRQRPFGPWTDRTKAARQALARVFFDRPNADNEAEHRATALPRTVLHSPEARGSSTDDLPAGASNGLWTRPLATDDRGP